MLGVADKSIQKWCIDYNIPSLKKDLINWYNTQVGIKEEEVVKIIRTDIKENKGKAKVIQINLQTNEVICTFKSAASAARALGKESSSNINRVCNKTRNSAYGFKWEYLIEQ